MDKIKFEYALSASLFSYRKYDKPYFDDLIFVEEKIEFFLRSLQWSTELKEFKNIDKVILRGRGNNKNLFTILHRKDKGFSLERISRSIYRQMKKEIMDITNISIQKYKEVIYITYKILY
jgi:hypothetical protein